jgi:flagellin-like hook-associated protein FlgL
MTGVQAVINAAVQAVEDVVNTATFEGRFLLKGQWSITLVDPESGEKRSLSLRSMGTGRLGGSSPGSLSSIGSGGMHALRRAQPSAVHAIIAKAAAQVSRQREELLSFSRRMIGPLSDALEIAAENADASENAVHDVDFASRTSHLTPVDALLSAAGKISRQPITRRSSVLRITRD